MNIHRRRVVAYIASNLVHPSQAGKILDVQATHESLMTGEVSPSLIAVFDHDRQDYVLGHPQPSNLVRLTDLACRHGIDLQVTGGAFTGVDFETGKTFTGNIEANKVMFFDDADHATYEYVV